jgi:hypothetical protein
MSKIKLIIVSLVAALGFILAAPSVTMAQSSPADEIRDGVNAIDSDNKSPSLGSQIEIVVNILLFILGAIAVVMIIIGGIRYATSNGDSSQIKTAKDTILYAVVGLIVAIMAYAIVGWVVQQFIPET